MTTPTELKYTPSHEWIKDNGDGTLTIGITKHAQDQLGDVVFVEVDKVGESLSAGDPVGVVESVKAVSDIYCPVDGEVIEANPDLDDEPALINEDSYGKGWIFKVKTSASLVGLLDAAAYEASLG